MSKKIIDFEVTATDGAARTGKMGLHRPTDHSFETPVFIPLASLGTLKGLTTEQILGLPHTPPILFVNAYHLSRRPGPDFLKEYGGIHKWLNWPHGILTDRGGFQMFCHTDPSVGTEEGLKFNSPNPDGSDKILTPEDMIHIQNSIGSNIALQLDDYVPMSMTGPRVEEAMNRSIRWLDRTIAAHERPDDQALFAIVQGGHDPNLRRQCSEEMSKRKEKLGGFAIGNLSNTESKDLFWKSLNASISGLPPEYPRYCMGVGYPDDIAVCIALGVDMFDCVYPTRTARFGNALTWKGIEHVSKWKNQDYPIEKDCHCWTCSHVTRTAIFHMQHSDMCGQLLTIHNVEFQNRLTSYLGEGIKKKQLGKYLKDFFTARYPDGNFPQWVIDALLSVNIDIKNC